ncbi:pyridoxal-dependent decarboxylase [Acidipila sp. EB88]|uniref:pyridoxal phosphate-dependent decarboxylase family protein n=1 Tax=Acidipila sp. EB88 TaxID=2305226 RepID=UPI001F25F1A1|nr:pyridoxal-dependent decarboxylase [Acidipila sp. EB88]
MDPPSEAAWEDFSAEAHRILDDTIAQMQHVREQAVWQPMPAAIQAAIAEAPAPIAERSLGAVYAELASRVLPYTSANRHPRAWGWVRGQGTPVAMLADMIASAANAHVGAGFTAPVHIEETVLRWLAEALGMQGAGAAEHAQPSGILTSGATMANLLGLAVARAAKAGYDVRQEGLSGRPRMLVYASTETHGWAAKAMELLGLGRRSLRSVAVDAAGRVQIEPLLRQIAADRAQGEQPFALIANAGTVNFGAVDDLRALRALCDEQDLWMHVDGAFGALLKLAPRYASLMDGLERADSVAFDLHKWMSLPFETGCLLVRDRAAHHAAFAAEAAYMEWSTRGVLSGGLSFANRGIESSRGFKALRVWMQLSVHGLRKHGALIAQNMEQAEHLEQRVLQHPELAMLAPRAMNIVCFRYVPAGHARTAAQLDACNREVVLRVQESGRFLISGTTLASGDYAIRVSITNHRSRLEDFDALVEWIVEEGRGQSARLL